MLIINNEALLLAAGTGNLDTVKYIIENGIDNHVLTVAAEKGHLDVVKYLLEKGYDPNEDEFQGVFLAIKNGHDEVVKVMAKQYLDFGICECRILTLIMEKNNLELLKFLKSEHLNILVDGYHGLREAVRCGCIEIADYLISKGSDVNNCRRSISALAASDKNMDMLKFLVSKGASVKGVLIYAVIYDDLEMLKFLLDNGANPNESKDYLAITIMGNNLEMLKLLIEKGAIITSSMIDDAVSFEAAVILSDAVLKRIYNKFC